MYAEASKKFDIFHIAVDDYHNAYDRYKTDIKESFGKVLGQRLRVSTINDLSGTICDCIEESIKGNGGEHLTEDNATIGVVTW